jgi:hypothetical protein
MDVGFSAPSKLYFCAGALFVLVAAIEFTDRGLEPRTVIGLLMAFAMVTLGVKVCRRNPI